MLNALSAGRPDPSAPEKSNRIRLLATWPVVEILAPERVGAFACVVSTVTDRPLKLAISCPPSIAFSVLPVVGFV